MIKSSFLINLYSSKYVDNLINKIILLNKNEKQYLYLFLNVRFIISLLIIILFIFIIPINIFITLMILLINHYLFEYFLINKKISAREKMLYNDGRDFYAMLIVFLDAKYPFKKALELTCESFDNELSLLFKEALNGIEMGRNTRDALKQISTRIPGKFNSKIIFYLIEYYENRINDTMKLNLIMNQEQKLDLLNIKNKIHFLPIKLILSTIFIFGPLMLVIIYFNDILDLLIK